MGLTIVLLLVSSLANFTAAKSTYHTFGRHHHNAGSNSTSVPASATDSVIAAVLSESNAQCSVVAAQDENPQYLDCTYQCFHDTVVVKNSYECQIATDGCSYSGTFDRFNYFSLLYCFFQGNLLLFMPISIFIIYLIFRFTSATVEEYIAEGITYMAEYFKMSEALAAVTLIALANGAGDVITAVVASGSSGGISYNIGSLYGAGFFVCSMVICLTILSSTQKITVDKSTIFRDCGFYILSTVVTLIYALMGEVYVWSALGFLIIYAMMVGVVYIQDKQKEGEKGDLGTLSLIKETSNAETLEQKDPSPQPNIQGSAKTIAQQAAQQKSSVAPENRGIRPNLQNSRDYQATQPPEGAQESQIDQHISSLGSKSPRNNKNLSTPIDQWGLNEVVSKSKFQAPALNVSEQLSPIFASHIISQKPQNVVETNKANYQLSKNLHHPSSSSQGLGPNGTQQQVIFGSQSVIEGAVTSSAPPKTGLAMSTALNKGFGGKQNALQRFKTSGQLQKVKMKIKMMAKIVNIQQSVILNIAQKKKLLQEQVKKEKQAKTSLEQVRQLHGESVVQAHDAEDPEDIIQKKGLEISPSKGGTEGDNDEEEEEDKPWEEMNLGERIDYCFEFPFSWIRKLTMPPCSTENYDKMLCIMWPFPGLIFVLWGINMLNYDNIVLLIPIAAALTAFFYYTQKDLKEKETPSYFFYISLLGTCVGLLWTYVVVDMLIDLLSLYVVIFRLNTTYMGLTILGVGNALPDALTTIALAKKGYAQMGITGSYAGQLFGLLIGFGFAQIKQTLIAGPQDFSLFEQPKENLLDILVIFFSLLNLVATSVYAIMNKYEYSKTLAYIVGGIYLLFFILATAVQVYLVIYGSI